MAVKLKLSKAKKRAWSAFSLWVRLAPASGDQVICITCGRQNSYKKMQAGHFVPGHHNAVMFDERGVHPQCYACNIVLGGNGIKYYKWMLEHYGQKVIDELERLDSGPAVIYSVDDYLEIEKKYQEKVKILLKS